MIQVRRTIEDGSPIFEVVVREGRGETRHHVTMSREMSERLTAGKHTPERYLEDDPIQRRHDHPRGARTEAGCDAFCHPRGRPDPRGERR